MTSTQSKHHRKGKNLITLQSSFESLIDKQMHKKKYDSYFCPHFHICGEFHDPNQPHKNDNRVHCIPHESYVLILVASCILCNRCISLVVILQEPYIISSLTLWHLTKSLRGH